MNNILYIFKKFCDLYNKMIKTYNKEINKILERFHRDNNSILSAITS